jgi:hypothetical protein
MKDIDALLAEALHLYEYGNPIKKEQLFKIFINAPEKKEEKNHTIESLCDKLIHIH